MADKEWISTEEVAQELGMTREWVRQQIKAGRLVATYYAINGRRTYRVHRHEYKRFVIRYQRETGGGR